MDSFFNTPFSKAGRAASRDRALTPGGSAAPGEQSMTALALPSPVVVMEDVLSYAQPGSSGVTRDSARNQSPDLRIDLTSEASYARHGPLLPGDVGASDTEISDIDQSVTITESLERRAKRLERAPQAARFFKDPSALDRSRLKLPRTRTKGTKSAKPRGSRSTARSSSPPPSDPEWTVSRATKRRRLSPVIPEEEIDDESSDAEDISDLPVASLAAKLLADLNQVQLLRKKSRNIKGQMRRLIETSKRIGQALFFF